MNERRDRNKRSSARRPSEGVRIIRPEEAQAALEAGRAAGRRGDDELRFGDVPPAPSGPRPQHRFPLPDSAEAGEEVTLSSRRVASDPPAQRNSPEEDMVTPEQWANGLWEPGDEPTSVTPVVAPESPSRGFVPRGEGIPSAPPAVPQEKAAAPPANRGRSANDPRAGSDRVANGADEEPVHGSARTAGREETTTQAAPFPTSPPAEGITMSGGGQTEMPHWTDPPTGEVPRILVDEPRSEDEDDFGAWKALGSRGVRWRNEGSDWDDLDHLSELGDEGTRVGALDQTRSEHSDLYSFDEEFQRMEERRSGPHTVVIEAASDATEGGSSTVVGGSKAGPNTREAATASTVPPPTVPPQAVPPQAGRSALGAPKGADASNEAGTPQGPSRPRGRRRGGPGGTGTPKGAGGEERSGRDVRTAVAVGVGLLVLLIALYEVGPAGLLALGAAVVLASGVEAYGMLQRSGFRPATLLGLVAIVGIMLAAYWRGSSAIGLISVLFFAATMVWYLLRIVDARPLANVAVTTMAFVWIGVLGSFGALMLRAHDGSGLFLGAAVTAVAADVAAFGAGSLFGSRPLAPHISPGKTVEGLVAGVIGAIVVGIVVGKFLPPWGGLVHGMALGVVVAVMAPIGDLFESMIKRDLRIKDSGSALPGHGGVLDRFDSILLVFPAAFYLATVLGLVK